MPLLYASCLVKQTNEILFPYLIFRFIAPPSSASDAEKKFVEAANVLAKYFAEEESPLREEWYQAKDDGLTLFYKVGLCLMVDKQSSRRSFATKKCLRSK